MSWMPVAQAGAAAGASGPDDDVPATQLDEPVFEALAPIGGGHAFSPPGVHAQLPPAVSTPWQPVAQAASVAHATNTGIGGNQAFATNGPPVGGVAVAAGRTAAPPAVFASRGGAAPLAGLRSAVTAEDLGRFDFELPENVSRFPRGYRRATTVPQNVLGTEFDAEGAGPTVAGRGLGAASAAAWPSGRGGAGAKRPAQQQKIPPAKRLRLRGGRFMSGPERARARKQRLQMAKKAVRRRVALWRARVVDGDKQVIYVSLGGQVIPKGGKAFKQATADAKYLKMHAIASNKPGGSSIDHPELLHPYVNRRSPDPRHMSHWCIPESVEDAYRDAGVRQLYPWQAACLSGPGVVDGRSLVYTAPTSAGKSLVSEILMLRQLLFRGKRALLVLPYVSICVERLEQLRRLFAGCGARIEALYGASEGYWSPGVDIAICTIERASSLVNRLIAEDALLRDIGVIVIDEMHLLGDDQRGYLLELILVKARLNAITAARAAAQAAEPERGPLAVAPRGPASPLQVIGLSATLPNVRLLADWLDAHLHISDDRPVPLSLSIASGRQTLARGDSNASIEGDSGGRTTDASRQRRDPDGLVPKVRESVNAGHGVLVFCPTKEACSKAAALLAEEFAAEAAMKAAEGALSSLEFPVSPQQRDKHDARSRLAEELRQAPSGLCPVLAKTIPRGIAYHHAGLTVEERAILEAGFRGGVISCICATATLSAGVNLPVRRVIIRSLKVGSEQLDAGRFRQMAGRAGRKGLDCQGECVLLARSEKEVTHAQELFEANLAPLRSSVRGQRLARSILEVVSLGLVRTMADLTGAFSSCLLRSQEERMATAANQQTGRTDSSQSLPRRLPSSQQVAGEVTLAEDIVAALKYLEEHRLLRADLVPNTQQALEPAASRQRPAASPAPPGQAAPADHSSLARSTPPASQQQQQQDMNPE
eukprot:TRINITY_DN26626_c0_g1_i2.p1 TRINITY_DN26626_c0_g1~~TRINITY_DN26626_c0_g1_i2.p1  ORF type:complete len:937 (+),score=178.52 TRINITY_DN26626_c0_g1_i2:158-2968(+)